jgi:hypothetical protein
MKIFSLESKTSLVGWSVVLGSMISLLGFITIRTTYQQDFCTLKSTDFYTSHPTYDCPPGRLINTVDSYGWPFQVKNTNDYYPAELSPNVFFEKEFFLDFIFWTCVTFIILSLGRYFRKKKTVSS